MPDLRKLHRGKLLVLIMLLILGCSREEHEVRIDFSFNNLEDGTLADRISSYTIVKLETEERSRINFIRKAVIANERIYILNHYENRQEILEFSPDGTFIGKITGTNDLEQLSGITDFDIQPATSYLALLDSEQKSVLLYNQDRTFIQKHELAEGARELSFGISGEKSITAVHAEPSRNANGPGHEIILYDENFHAIRTCFPYEEDLNSVFGKSRSLMTCDGKVYYLREGSNELYALGTKCERIAELEFPKPVLPLDKRYDALFRGTEDLSQYVFDLKYYETNKTLLTAFSGTEGEYYGIFDKTSDSSMLYTVSYDPDCFCSIKIDIAGASGDYFIIQIPRTKIKKVLSALDSDRSRCLNPDMFELIEKMKPGENPILLLLELN